MPLPKRKHSHARTTQRRANNWKIEVPNVGTCPRCHAPRLAHHVCSSCGFYGNRMVIDVKAKGREEQETRGESDAQE
jgi:large subunit ribosomal protein L32